jgi:acyl-CoA dehydrogenase
MALGHLAKTVAKVVHFGRGCQTDHNIERYLRDVIHTFPAAGTSDVQRLRLAEVALGNYRGAWSTRLSSEPVVTGIAA